MALHGGDTDACRALHLDGEMIDTLINRLSVKHAYQQVADVIGARIETGRYTIKLPGERDPAEEFGVSYITVRHATAILRERRMIVSIHGRGTFVASALVDQV
jgi:GntR family transcriptional regulator